MYNALGTRFLERNVRFGLGGSGHVNRALARAFRQLLMDGSADPTAFALHHNGVTLSAGRLRLEQDPPVILAPRLLNGAQTISTFARVRDELGAKFQSLSVERVRSIQVLCRIITDADANVVKRITIDSNRQNPIDSWLLHANDLIQLKFADFIGQIRIYYERQANAFQALTEQDREEANIEDVKPIQMLRLARTYLAVEGKLSRLSQLGEVADSESQYDAIFNESRLQFNPRVVVFCYKIQFNLRMLVRSIQDVGPNKYAFIHRGKDMLWALVCQAFLNDDKHSELADEFGGDLRRPHKYIELIDYYATRARIILSRLVSEVPYSNMIQQDSYSFLRKEDTFNRAMKIASEKWGWKLKLLQ